MRLKTVSGLALILLLISALLLSFNTSKTKAAPATITVPDDYPTVQEAVNAASEHDKIVVKEGTYTENINVDKAVTIESEKGAKVTFVQPADPDDDVFMVQANHVSIKGFTIGGPEKSYACIVLVNVLNNTISNNVLQGNDIDFSLSSNNTLRNNVFVNGGLYVFRSYENIMENNTVNGKPLVYLEDASGSAITNAGQVVLVNCANITVKNSNLSSTCMGLELYGTSNCRIRNNLMNSNSWNGISVFEYSSNNTISNNTMRANFRGICVSRHSSDNMISNNTMCDNHHALLSIESNTNTIVNNTICGNINGIWMTDSSHNLICNNNFIDNTFQVHSETSENIWDAGYPDGGNYWSDHVCTGNPSTGSQSYTIDTNNIDHYPFQDPSGWLLNQLTVASSPLTGITFAINGAPQITPYTEWLLVSSYILEAPEVHGEYVWSHWLEDGDTNRTKPFVLAGDINWTGVFRYRADINGDGKVRVDDVMVAAEAFGSYCTQAFLLPICHSRWNPDADLNDDWRIRVDDILAVALKFGWG